MQTRKQLSKIVLLLSIIILVTGSLIHYRFGYFSYDLSGHAWGIDDAYISYRYAQNLSQGNGLVFNAGEYVEGYSNLLFVIIVSIFLSIGIDITNVYFIITVFNLSVAIIIVIIFYAFLNCFLGQQKAAIGSLLLSFSPLIWVWVSAGMEFPLVLLFQLIIWIAVTQLDIQNSKTFIGVWTGATILLCLTRADGFVFPIISIIFLILKRKYRLVLILLIPLILSIGILTYWRYTYYGQILPNTYYAKVSGPFTDRVLFATFLLAQIAIFQGFLGYIATLMHSIYLIIRARLTSHQRIYHNLNFHVFASSTWLVFWLFTGGGTRAERFLIILIPFSIFAMLSRLNDGTKKESQIITSIFVLLQLGIIFTDPRFDYTHGKYDRWIRLGNFLAINHKGETIAADAVGKISLFGGLYTIDMLGLNDPHIAKIEPDFVHPGHNKFDPDYVFGQNPDLISAWIAACTQGDCNWLDLSYGMTEEYYQEKGYTMGYLIYSGVMPSGEWILDVSNFDRQVKLNLINQDYKYGVLRRIKDISP